MPTADGLPRPALAVVVAVGFAVLAGRRVDALGDPKLWAEDGVVFLRDAYLGSWPATVLRPVAGYLLVLPRAWAEATTLLAVRHAALSYTLFALVSATGCCAVVLSSRLRWLIPSDAHRVAVFLALILLPGIGEVHATLTNAQWSFGIALVLLALAVEPLRRSWRRLELAGSAVLGLSTATTLVLWPLFWLRWTRERTRHNLALAGALTTCAAVQAALVVGSRVREGGGLELADPGGIASGLLLRIAAVVAVGQGRLGEALARPSLPPVIWAVAALVAISAVAALAVLSPRERTPFLAAMATTCGAVVWVFSGDFTTLRHTPLGGGRYFVLQIALLVVLWGAATSRLRRRPVLVRVLGAAGPLLLLFGILGDAVLPALPTIHWPRSAACISAQRECVVPLNPQGWTVHLPPVSGVR